MRVEVRPASYGRSIKVDLNPVFWAIHRKSARADEAEYHDEVIKEGRGCRQIDESAYYSLNEYGRVRLRIDPDMVTRTYGNDMERAIKFSDAVGLGEALKLELRHFEERRTTTSPLFVLRISPSC